MVHMRRVYFFLESMLLGFWIFLVPVQSVAAHFTRILPPELAKPSNPLTLVDLYRQIDASNQIVDQFIAATGETRKEHPKISIHNAQARDIEFESVSLYDQVHLLAFEYTRETYPSASELSLKGDSLEKSWDILNQLLRILYELQPLLDRSQPLKIAEINATNPSELVLMLINLTEKMDDLAWFEYSPSDTFKVITQGIYIAAALIERSPDPQPIPEPHLFKRGITSPENYQHLLTIIKTLGEIARLKNISFIQVDAEHASTAKTFDVYNLSILINSQLLYLYHQIFPDGVVLEAYYPGWKFPSHVYQRIGILEQQINQLVGIALKHPNWLLNKPVKNG